MAGYIQDYFSTAYQTGVEVSFMRDISDSTAPYKNVFKVAEEKLPIERVSIVGFDGYKAAGDSEVMPSDKLKQGFAITPETVQYVKNAYFTKKEIRDFEAGIRPGYLNELSAELSLGALRLLNKSCFNFLSYQLDGTGPAGADSKRLFATDHPYDSGVSGTQSNKTTGVMTQSKVEDMIEALLVQKGAYSDDYLDVDLNDVAVIYDGSNWGNAKRIFETQGQPGVPNNDINTVKGIKHFPVPFLATTTEFYVIDMKRAKLNVVFDVMPMIESPFYTTPRAGYIQGVLSFDVLGYDWRYMIASTGL